MAEKNYFEQLAAIDVGSKIEKKNGLSYLSWAWAWAEVKKRHPEATYTIYKNADGWFYHTDGKTCWVETGVTIGMVEHVEYLPVMDFRNSSIHAEKVTSFDVNKAIQRSLTKAVARHGLGLYIYAGEDLPEDAEPAPKGMKGKPVHDVGAYPCEDCKKPIPAYHKGDIHLTSAEIATKSIEKYGKQLCIACGKKHAAQLEPA